MLTAFCAPLAAGASALVAAPEYLAATIVLIASVGLYVNGLMRAEVRHRGESVLDPLTGLLNRATLDQRFEEVRQQAILAHVPVAFVLFDLDHFKAVNDTYGHETGDAVLRDVAYEMRKSLRSFELAYRVGGEELLLILPGTDEAEAAGLAERVRRHVAASRPGGISVTISAGISAGFGDELSLRAPLRARRRPAVRGQERRPQPRRPEPARDERVPAARGLSAPLSARAARACGSGRARARRRRSASPRRGSRSSRRARGTRTL